MAGKHEIPTVLNNFNVYNDAKSALLVGVADIELPEIEFLTESIKGAGISGEIEAVIQGHVAPMEVTINFHAQSKNTIELCNSLYGQKITCRSSIGSYDAASGAIASIGDRLHMTIGVKNIALGKRETGSALDSGVTVAVMALKYVIVGKTVLDIDPANMIFKVNGTDILKGVKKDLGIY